MNSVEIFNAAGGSKNNVGTAEFIISIAKSYIHKSQRKRKNTKRLDKVNRNTVLMVQ